MKKRITFTFDEKTIEDLKKLSEQTRIPQARLVEDAVIELVRKSAEPK